MTDNNFIRIFLDELKNAMAQAGQTVSVLQSYQPTKQGTKSNPTLYFTKIGEKKIGSPKRLSQYDETGEKMNDIDTQVVEATYQISALVRQPSDTDMTASDMLDVAQMALQSWEGLATLRAHGIGILRITEVRNPYMQDDRDEWQAMPSFDVVFSYSKTYTRQSKSIATIHVGTNSINDVRYLSFITCDDSIDCDGALVC